MDCTYITLFLEPLLFPKANYKGLSFTHTFIYQWVAAAMQGTDKPHWEQLGLRRGRLVRESGGNH